MDRGHSEKWSLETPLRSNCDGLKHKAEVRDPVLIHEEWAWGAVTLSIQMHRVGTNAAKDVKTRAARTYKALLKTQWGSEGGKTPAPWAQRAMLCDATCVEEGFRSRQTHEAASGIRVMLWGRAGRWDCLGAQSFPWGDDKVLQLMVAQHCVGT